MPDLESLDASHFFFHLFFGCNWPVSIVRQQDAEFGPKVNSGVKSVPEGSGWKRLTETVGPENVIFDTGPLRQRGWEGALPRACVTPLSCEQVCEVMRLAHAERWRVSPAGNSTKQRMGGIPQGIDLVLSLRRLNRVTDYQPADLTVSVEAGLRMEELGAVLGAHGQMLPLDVPFAAGATVGGMMVTNGSGPRRLAYGSLRDMVIGVRFVTSEGKLVKSGGKVVKNVAGYDMAKILIGSFGTLGIITGATFKVFPIPPASITFVLGFPTAEQALQARRHILNSPIAPQALDLLDSAAGALIQKDVLSASPYTLVVAAAGPEAVVERVRRELPLLVRQDGLEKVSYLAGEPEAKLWSAIQDLTSTVIERSPDSAVVKASVLLSQVGSVIERARQAGSDTGLAVATLARAGTGIVYCYLSPASDADKGTSIEGTSKACEFLLEETARLGGGAVVEWCPSEVKEKISLWAPLGDDFPMMQRLKAQLDPQGILNPGRLWGRI